ncbi:MAG TPA: SAM-dependent chlorinase/fluorinase [Gemmatimonadaceae bacterium]|nr:SAM-dependent chlorinase/fluorinase [Gemmatimonadaceae bacterium]
MARALVTLLTDFGTADGYVAEMKGVLLTGAREAAIIDISHEVPPQDVDAGRLALARYWKRFPEGTIHLAVVDPGVGTGRHALAVESQRRYLIGPDNGVLSPALLAPGARVLRLPVPPGASATFHGRDVFAPAAVHLANGQAFDALGSPVAEPIIRRTPDPHRAADGSIVGQVLTIDRFGNLITNLLGVRGGTVAVAGHVVPVRHTYADAQPGDAVAVVGSSGLLEIAVRDGSAAAVLGVARGGVVALRAG